MGLSPLQNCKIGFFLLGIASSLWGVHEFGPWGADADLTLPIQKHCEKKYSVAVMPALALVSFHQSFLSPVSGPRSHFRPSSSQYMIQAVEKYGPIEGFFRGMDRLMRENRDPWVYSRVDMSRGSWMKLETP